PSGAFSEAARVHTEAEAGVPLTLLVTDLDLRPLAGARVEVDGADVGTTDASGVIVLDEVAEGEVAVRVEVDGRPPTAERFTVRRGVDNELSIPMMAYQLHDRFDPAAPATVEVDEIRVELPAGAWRDKETGAPVSGPIDVYVAPFPIGDLAARDRAPGDWTGRTEGGATVSFASFGMAEIAFFADGRPVDLPAGATATLSYALPFGADVEEGEEIPAWSFDEATATWVQEGAGVVEVGAFGELRWVAEVGHFTWWNSDRPWYDTNCILAYGHLFGTDIYVPGISVVTLGLDYDGWYAAHAGVAYSVCAEMLYGGTAEVSAYSPYYGRATWPVNVVGDLFPAECPVVAEGQCQEVDFEFTPHTCVEGTVLDAQGRPAAGVVVTVDLDDFAFDSVAEDFSVTDASGHYCLSVPPLESAEVVFWGPDGGVTAVPLLPFGGPGASCGGGECEQLNQGQPVQLRPAPTGCVRGRVVRGDQPSPYPPAPEGTTVYVYTDDAEVQVSCEAGDDAPDLWGALAWTALTDAAGEFCVDGIDLAYTGFSSNDAGERVPYFTRGLRVVGGDCAYDPTAERLSPAYAGPEQRGSCATPERCFDVGEVGAPPEVSQ
ncbi:MAG TPA: carboxypeptidase-like regulatory domain-containing protein, partial [Myxococcota bacterium]|nr:carboxypeptidase-like regulatory domain-containing protein [Myxococcota bacterium]